ncbi:MAG TPA: YetF domain-containing protein, partial [Deinococcales bacterium]|nr:YetF domain-containing protein [Deinococcales bacterium]
MIDWLKVFAPDTPPLEIIARGSAMYLAIFFILRVVMKRQSGTVGVSDLLVIVMIADAAQNGMASDYKSVADGVLLVATIVAWSYVLDYLAYKSPFIERLLQSQPLPLVQDGRMSKQNMRRELITVGELQALLRERGV